MVIGIRARPRWPSNISVNQNSKIEISEQL